MTIEIVTAQWNPSTTIWTTIFYVLEKKTSNPDLALHCMDFRYEIALNKNDQGSSIKRSLYLFECVENIEFDLTSHV